MSSFVIYIQCILLMYSSMVHASHFLLNSPGEVSPIRAQIEVGGSVDIECRMNPEKFKGKNSSSLYFVEADTKRRVPSRDIAIVDETAIVYMIRNATKQDREYYCQFEQQGGIAIARVLVGTKPTDVNDFKCRGYDYSYMICNFTAPQNEIEVQYELSYTAHDQNFKQPCDLDVEEQQRICNLTTTKANYRKSYEFFNFTLIGTNSLGKNIQHFWINQYESVIPARPEFSFTNITTDSVGLSWHLVMYSYYKRKGLQYEIRLRPKHFDWINISNYENSSKHEKYKVMLRNLEYAYYDYTVRMRLKVKTAYNDDTMWSEAYESTFRTKPRVPQHSPRTDVGSFYIDPSDHVRLYWHELPVYRYNGPDFHYLVKEVKLDGITINSSPIRINHTSIPAIFEWNKNHRYEFTISSRNDVGESVESSQIVVPAMPNKYRKERSPKWIRNNYHGSNRTYTLSWTAPSNQTNLMDYTVFWCRSKPGTLNECKDTIRFKRINKREMKYSTEPQEQETALNFAVSANYDDNFSSGMHWIMCTADVLSDLIKMEPDITALPGGVIRVQWSIDRICLSLLEGYKLSYCRVDNATNGQCVDNQNFTIIIEKSANKHLLKELKPHSTYKIEMYMFSKLKQGKASDVKYIETEEEAPMRPRALKLHNITTNSAWISWLPPTELNGILRHYIVVLNDERLAINCTDGTLNDPCNINNTKNYKLENLSSFTNYKVYIIAYTVKESQPSNDIDFVTLIGIPSNPRSMAENDSTSSTLTMKWSKPDVPSGHVDFYEVAVIVSRNDEIIRKRISGVIGSTSCVMANPTCADSKVKTTVQVRAVNVVERNHENDSHISSVNSTDDDPDDKFYTDNDDLKCSGTAAPGYEQLKNITRYRNMNRYVQYKSAWEKGPNYGCARNQNAQVLIYPLVAMLAGLVVVMFFQLRKKYIKMATINIALPAGLDDYQFKGNICGGIDNSSIEKDSEFLNHHIVGDSKNESIYTDFENRRLLSAVYTNDSRAYFLRGGGRPAGAGGARDAGIKASLGIIDSGVGSRVANGGVGGVTTIPLDKSFGYVGSDRSADFIDHDVLPMKPEFNPPANDAYMVMERLKPTNTNQQQKLSTTDMPTNIDRQQDNNGYVYPSEPMPSSIIPAENGYIKPNKSQMFNAWQQDPRATTTTPFGAVSSSGYVAPICLSKTTTIPAATHPPLDGYTSLKELMGKHQLPRTFNSPSKAAQSSSAISPTHIVNDEIIPISGYVTQKELSAMQQHRMS